MTAVFYLKQATQRYSDAALNWANSSNFELSTISGKLGITVASIIIGVRVALF